MAEEEVVAAGVEEGQQLEESQLLLQQLLKAVVSGMGLFSSVTTSVVSSEVEEVDMMTTMLMLRLLVP